MYRIKIAYQFLIQALQSALMALVILLEVFITLISNNKKKVLLIEGESSSEELKLRSRLKRAFADLGYIILYAPASALKCVYKSTITLYKCLVHYYCNFYRKGRPLRTLFPAYQDITISRITRILVTGATGEKFSYFSAFKFIIRFTIRWSISLFLAAFVAILLYTLRDIPVSKFLFTLMSIGFFTYLLISGFVFFLKKYKYGKYTTAMHRY